MYDICIIGAGIVGTSIAQRLSRYKLNIVVLEKHNDIACGATKANSALIHAGFDAPFGTLMNKLNVQGNELYKDLCKELSIPYKQNGALVLAKTNEEKEIINQLKANGDLSGVPNLEILAEKQIYDMEPNLNKGYIAALYAPTAGIINPWEAAIGFMENAMENDVELIRNFGVSDISCNNNVYAITSINSKQINAKIVINASGVSAGDILELVEPRDFSIFPRKGEYFLLDQEANGLVQKTIFGCPTPMGKGIVISPTVDGNALIGPTSENMPVFLKEDTSTSYLGLETVMKRGKELVREIPFDLNITNYAGVRAEPSTHDFIIKSAKKHPSFINVAGIKSPGLSSAPAISIYVEEIIKKIDMNLINKDGYIGKRYRKPFVNEMSYKERNGMIERNSLYGRIICRCEEISEGEIVDAIHQACGATSVNGVKRRTRPGAGRCQGGFCGPKVVEIIARELKIDPLDVLLEDEGSNVLKYETKPLIGGVV